MPIREFDRVDEIARALRARYYDRKGLEMTTLYANLPPHRRNNWRRIAEDAIELTAAHQ